MLEISCPQCHGRFRADTNGGFTQFQCPHCASPVSIQSPLPTPVAKPIAPMDAAGQRGPSTLVVVLGILAICFGLLIAIVGGFVVYRYSASERVAEGASVPTPVDRAAEMPAPAPRAAVDVPDPVEGLTPSAVPPSTIPTPQTKAPHTLSPTSEPDVTEDSTGSGTPPDDPFEALASSDTKSATDTKPQPAKPAAKIRIGDPIRYQMVAGSQYNYRLGVKANVDDRQEEMFGSIAYTISPDDPRKLTRLQRRGLLDEKDVRRPVSMTLINFSGSATSSSGSFDGDNHMFTSGQQVFDEFGKLLGTKKEEMPGYQGKRNSSMIKYVFDPIERMPLIEFPANGQTTWTEKRTFQLTVAHSDSRSSQLRSRIYSMAPRARSTAGTITNLEIEQTASYEIERDRENEILISRVIQGKPVSKDGLTLDFERTEEIRFDKTERVVRSIDCKGAITLTKKNWSLKIPFEYDLKLNEILSAKAVAKKAAERKARAKRVAKLKEGESVPIGKHDSELRRNAAETYSKLKYTQPLSDVKNSQSVIWSSDSRFLICNSRTYIVSVLDVLRDEVVFTSGSIDGLQPAMALSDDGKTLLLSGRDGTILVMSLERDGSLNELARLSPEKNSYVTALAIDPTGVYALAGYRNKTAVLWNLETQKAECRSDQFKYDVKAVGFAGDGKTGIACCPENAVYFDVKNGSVKKSIETFRQYTAHSMDFSDDGEQLVVSEGSKVGLYDTKEMKRQATLDVDDSVTWKASFLPDGKHVLLGSKSLSIWNTSTRQHVAEFRPAGSGYAQVFDASPNGQFVATSVNSGTPEVVVNPLLPATKKSKLMATAGMVMGDDGKFKKGEVVGKLDFPAYQAKATAFSKDNRYLYVSGGESAVFDLKNKKRLQKIERFREEGQVNVLAVADDGSKVLMGTYSGKILIFDVGADGKLTQRGSYIGHAQSVQSIAIGPKSKIVVSGERKRVRVWDLKSTRELGSVEMEDSVQACRILQGGKTAVVTDGKWVKTISLKNMKVLNAVKVEGYYSSSDLTVDGKFLVVGDYKTTKLIDTKTGKEAREISRSTGSQTWIILPDNEHALVAKYDSTEIVNLKQGKTVARMKSKGLRAEAIACSPDGTLFAAPSSSNELLVLNSPLVE